MIRALLLVGLWLAAAPLLASDLQPLLDSGDLQVESRVEPGEHKYNHQNFLTAPSHSFSICVRFTFQEI